MDLSENAEGRPVIDADDSPVGRVAEVRDGDPFVEPFPDLDPARRSELGWGGDDRDRYRLDGAFVETVRSAEIRIATDSAE